MQIETRGVETTNLGSALMLLAIEQRLAQSLPAHRLVLTPSRRLPFDAVQQHHALSRLPLTKGRFNLEWLGSRLPTAMRRLLRRYGVVTEADVDVILDASGYAYGGHWHLNSCRRLASALRRGRRAGRLSILLPQAFGPFTDPQRRVLSDCLANADQVYARDRESLAHLRSLGDASHIQLAPDFTLLLRPAVVHSASGPRVATVVPNRKLFSSASAAAAAASCRQLFTPTIRLLQGRGLAVQIVCFDAEEDADLCADLAQETGATLCPSAPPLQVKGLLAHSHLVIAGRYHACVSALSEAVPCVGVGWSHKYQHLFDDFQVSSLLAAAEAQCLVAAALHALEQHENLRQQLQQSSERLRGQAHHMWQRVESAIQERSSARGRVL